MYEVKMKQITLKFDDEVEQLEFVFSIRNINRRLLQSTGNAGYEAIFMGKVMTGFSRGSWLSLGKEQVQKS